VQRLTIPSMLRFSMQSITRTTKVFILASADDRYVPVYAYVPEGNFEKNNIPESGFKDILDNLIYKVTNPEDSTHYKVYIAQIMKYPDEWYE